MLVLLLDKNQKIVKEIGKKVLRKRNFSKLEIEGTKNFFGYVVYKNNLYYSGSNTDFIIEVFDSNGDKLHQLKMDYKKVLVSNRYKKAFKKKYMESNKRMVASIQENIEFRKGSQRTKKSILPQRAPRALR